MKKIVSVVLMLSVLCGTSAVFAEEIKSATFQDTNNIVIDWDSENGIEFEVLRAEAFDGNYEHIGTSDVSSFRDDTIEFPNTYYYKIKNTATGNISEPIKSGENSQPIKSVYVIMYHHFVTNQDIEEGVKFEEYSLMAEDFEKDLIWLRDNGFTTITSDELLEYFNGSKSLPDKAIILSIDDGSRGVYKNAYPLLKKYNMKADFNVIGTLIDETWEYLSDGGDRTGEPAPYCTWEELAEMQKSGHVNICSHSYGLHVYDREGRLGLCMIDGEDENEYMALMKADYELCVSCINGWLGKMPTTVAYPYSKRTAYGDELILQSTGYKILMAGEEQRGSAINHFVTGCDLKQQLVVMSRPCRMDKVPISTYIEKVENKDFSNGVNSAPNTLSITAQESKKVSLDYQIFKDVNKTDWFAPSAYYAYVNGLIKGTSYTEFSPDLHITRAMAASLMYRISNEPATFSDMKFSDVDAGSWYFDATVWATENKILEESNGYFSPDEAISRENLVYSMYKCAEYMQIPSKIKGDIKKFTDSTKIDDKNIEAREWAVGNGVISGTGDGKVNPDGYVTRAEMAAILQNFLSEINKGD